MNFTHAIKAGFVAAALVLGTTVAKADPMIFSGTTTGSFSSTGTSTFQGLSFANGTFNGSTSDQGDVAFGQAGNPNGSFGSFTLTSSTQTYTGQTFNLNILFTNPTGINGGQNSTFTGTATGTVTSIVPTTGQPGGGVRIVFSPVLESYTFSNGAQIGSFTLQLDTLSLYPNQTNAISGYIQSVATAPTPEPNSLMLLGTGFVSAAGMMMRRRKAMTA